MSRWPSKRRNGTSSRALLLARWSPKLGAISNYQTVSRETVRKLLRTGQPPHHQPPHRRVDKGLPGGAQPFVVLRHSTVMRDPREGALHHPPPRQHPKTLRWHQPLPIHRLSLLGPLRGPQLCHLLGDRLL